MDQDNNVQAAVEAGKQIADVKTRITHVGNIPVALTETEKGSHVGVLDAVLAKQDERADAPRRLRGTATHHEQASFIAHVNRFKDEDSTIWADAGSVRLTAVLNYHRGALADAGVALKPSPRWNDHRAVYACPLSEQWKRWIANNEKWMTQEAFGQFVEDNLTDLANPDPGNALDKDMPPPARVLEVARSLVVNAKTDFQRTINPTTGEGVFTWKKDNEVQGTTKVPKSFLLGIPVFDAGEAYRIEARLRYSVDNGVAKFQFALYQPQAIVRDAFDKVRKQVAEGTRLLVFAGSPEQ